MPLIFSADDLGVMAQVRAAIDPVGSFNPAKILPTSGSGHAVPGVRVPQAGVPEGMWV
jgi:hypothetical protein